MLLLSSGESCELPPFPPVVLVSSDTRVLIQLTSRALPRRFRNMGDPVTEYSARFQQQVSRRSMTRQANVSNEAKRVFDHNAVPDFIQEAQNLWFFFLVTAILNQFNLKDNIFLVFYSCLPLGLLIKY